MKRVFSWPYNRNGDGRGTSEQSESKSILSPTPHSDGVLNSDISSNLFAEFCNEEQVQPLAQLGEGSRQSLENSEKRQIDSLFQAVKEEENVSFDGPEEGEIVEKQEEEQEEEEEEEYVLSKEDSVILEEAFTRAFSGEASLNANVPSATPEVGSESNASQNGKRKREHCEPEPLRLREWIDNIEQEAIANGQEAQDEVIVLKERVTLLEAEIVRLNDQVKMFKRHIFGVCSSLLAY